MDNNDNPLAPQNAAIKHALKIVKGIHRLCNAEIRIGEIDYPCHHSAFENMAPLHTEGRAKSRNISSIVVVPLFTFKGEPYNIEGKIVEGDTLKVTSTIRRALSHKLRVEKFELDETSFTLTVTDIRR